MKSFIQLVSLLAIVMLVRTEKENEMRAIMEQHVKECIKEENASESDINDLTKWIIPDTKEGRCLVACVAERSKIIEANHFSPEKVVEITEKMYEPNDEGRDDAIKAMRHISEECRSVTHEDRCQMAVDIIACFKAVKEREAQALE